MTDTRADLRRNVHAFIFGLAVLAACALYWFDLAQQLPLWHDEAITLLDIAGNPSPDWASGWYTAGEIREAYTGIGEIGDIARDLRETDVHPPIYYYVAHLWAQVFGNEIVALQVPVDPARGRGPGLRLVDGAQGVPPGRNDLPPGPGRLAHGADGGAQCAQLCPRPPRGHPLPRHRPGSPAASRAEPSPDLRRSQHDGPRGRAGLHDATT